MNFEILEVPLAERSVTEYKKKYYFHSRPTLKTFHENCKTTPVIHRYVWALFITGNCSSLDITKSVFTLVLGHPPSSFIYKHFTAALKFRLERVTRQKSCTKFGSLLHIKSLN